jgi:uncharacterized phage-associated protein
MSLKKEGKKMSGTYNVYDIAKYFLWRAQTEDQELLSNMKLQKLVYYAQGLHLTLYKVPLFDDRIEAWTYGPVVPDLYHHYKIYEAGGIPADPNFDPSTIDKDTKDFLDEIYQVFGQFSAIRLMEIAHRDKCLIDAAKTNSEISHESMRKCLKKYVKNG